jgi:hypothetical protein
MSDQRVSPIEGAERWSYGAFEHGQGRGPIKIPSVRDDGLSAEFTVPDFVNDPEDLRTIALVVINAREKWDDVKGMGA